MNGSGVYAVYITGVSASKDRIDIKQDRGLTASLRCEIRSFLSLAFFKPANAIFVPGMYWRACEQAPAIQDISVPFWGSRGTRRGSARPRWCPCWHWQPSKRNRLPDQSYGRKFWRKLTRHVRMSCQRWVVARPTHPWRLGPTLWGSPLPRVWHWAQRVLKRPAPLEASPIRNIGQKLCSLRPAACEDAHQQRKRQALSSIEPKKKV